MFVGTLLFKDSPTPANKALVEFLKSSIEKLVINKKIQFKFHIVQKDEYPRLEKDGIKELPILIVGKERYVTVPIIKKYLLDLMRTPVKSQKANAESALDDYQKKCALGDVRLDGKGKHIVETDTDETVTAASAIQSKLSQMLKARSKAGLHGPTTDTLETKSAINRQGNTTFSTGDEMEDKQTNDLLEKDRDNNLSDNTLDLIDNGRGNAEDQQDNELLRKMYANTLSDE